MGGSRDRRPAVASLLAAVALQRSRESDEEKREHKIEGGGALVGYWRFIFTPQNDHTGSTLLLFINAQAHSSGIDAFGAADSQSTREGSSVLRRRGCYISLKTACRPPRSQLAAVDRSHRMTAAASRGAFKAVEWEVCGRVRFWVRWIWVCWLGPTDGGGVCIACCGIRDTYLAYCCTRSDL